MVGFVGLKVLFKCGYFLEPIVVLQVLILVIKVRTYLVGPFGGYISDGDGQHRCNAGAKALRRGKIKENPAVVAQDVLIEWFVPNGHDATEYVLVY